MTELETIARAQMYLEKLARGIDPLDGSRIPGGDVVRQPRISKCFLFAADVLRRTVENGGIPERPPKVKKQPFTITCEQREAVEVSEAPATISEVAGRLNTAVNDPTIQRIGYTAIAEWLVESGLLETVRLPEGRERKRLSALGRGFGFSTELREGSHGTYETIVLDRTAQQFIIDHIDAVIERANVVYEMQGKPWTEEQDAALADLYRQGATVAELSAALQRAPSSIRARIRRLGKQGRLGSR